MSLIGATVLFVSLALFACIVPARKALKVQPVEALRYEWFENSVGVEMEIKRNEAARRFETEVEGKMGVLEYRMAGHSIVFTHTGVPPEIEGHGIASALTQAGLEYARTQQLKVVPQCPFVREYLVKHSEYNDLVD